MFLEAVLFSVGRGGRTTEMLGRLKDAKALVLKDQGLLRMRPKGIGRD